MVRDPSIVSPSLTGVFNGGGGIINTVQDRGARCRSSIVPPLHHLPGRRRRRWRCDRSSYKRSLFGRIRDSQMHYLTGPETTVRRLPSPSRISVGVEPLRDEQAHQYSFCDSPRHQLVNCQNSCCARGERALTECVAGAGTGRGQGMGAGEDFSNDVDGDVINTRAI